MNLKKKYTKCKQMLSESPRAYPTHKPHNTYRISHTLHISHKLCIRQLRKPWKPSRVLYLRPQELPRGLCLPWEPPHGLSTLGTPTRSSCLGNTHKVFLPNKHNANYTSKYFRIPWKPSKILYQKPWEPPRGLPCK